MLPLHRVLLASFLVGTGPFVLGQATITSGMLTFVPGEQFSTTGCDSVGHGTAGAAQTWDFSTLPGCSGTYPAVWEEPTGLTDFEYTVSCSFPPNSISKFYVGTADVFQLVVDAPLPNEAYNYTDPRDMVRYPMAFGDSFTDMFSGSRDAGMPDYETFEGSTTVTYDGHGTLTGPWGTLTDVFRLHAQDTILYSISTYFSRAIDEYRYFRPGSHQPVLVLTYTTYLSSGLSYGRTSLTLPANTAITENETAADILLYPDPVVDQAVVRTNARTNTVHAFDLSGRTVSLPFTPENGSIRIDASALASGVYTMVLSGPDGRTGRRFVKQ